MKVKSNDKVLPSATRAHQRAHSQKKKTAALELKDLTDKVAQKRIVNLVAQLEVTVKIRNIITSSSTPMDIDPPTSYSPTPMDISPVKQTYPQPMDISPQGSPAKPTYPQPMDISPVKQTYPQPMDISPARPLYAPMQTSPDKSFAYAALGANPSSMQTYPGQLAFAGQAAPSFPSWGAPRVLFGEEELDTSTDVQMSERPVATARRRVTTARGKRRFVELQRLDKDARSTASSATFKAKPAVFKPVTTAPSLAHTKTVILAQNSELARIETEALKRVESSAPIRARDTSRSSAAHMMFISRVMANHAAQEAQKELGKSRRNVDALLLA